MKENLELVTIGKNKKEKTSSIPTDISRRKFLKVLGASSALGLAACADDASQKIYPYVKGETEQIPGVAQWYSSTCNECSAGCGIIVRTREGRAVKIEGNSNHPINKGGLCALGQASLQHLYDPDRIRQPLKRSTNAAGKPTFVPVSWDEAYQMVVEGLSKGNDKNALVSGEISGALKELSRDWVKKFSVSQVVFEPLQPVALAKASELVYGSYGIPHYAFDKAEMVLNFGADFLETWVSPCEYARAWAKSRKSDHPLRMVQVEPRLSLTGANADLWLSIKPGTEVKLALAILKTLLERNKGENLSDDIQRELKKLAKEVSIEEVSKETGVSQEKILLVSHYLEEAESSIVLAGGTTTSTQEPLSLYIITHFLNLVLGNVGTSVSLSKMRRPETDISKLASLLKSIEEGQVKTLLIYGCNPRFNLPSDFGFEYALKKVPLVVGFLSHMDETAELCHLILPPHTSLESWGSTNPYEGIYNLMQPAMTPVFDTKNIGDMFLEIASRAGKPVSHSAIDLNKGGTEKIADFHAYVKATWEAIHASEGIGSDFSSFWLESLDKGGYFSPNEERVKVKVDRSVFERVYDTVKFNAKGAEENDPILLPYPSIKSFDGRAANRPWLQELPDPMTQVVWDSWAEVHPSMAQKYDLQKGDIVTVRNHYGELNLPVYINEHLHPDIVAVPMGQGHSAYGRFASQVKGGNVFELLHADTPEGGGLNFFADRVKLLRGRGRAHMVVVQGSDSQLHRDLAKTTFLGAAHAAAESHDHEEEHGHGHEPKQMYVQREHPVYEWGLNVDLSACTGCSACVVACYAENNIPVVGKSACSKGREMSWLRIERYFDEGKEYPAEEFHVSFLPMMCQHCHNAPCEPVCPVYATYHNEEGLNTMIYNRCVGTRYCSNNCSYKVRRFNWYEYEVPEPLSWQLNPDVTKRSAGVMEKCTFCIQRIVEAKDRAKDLGHLVEDGEVKPACVQSCPTQALTFGNLNDHESKVSKLAHHKRAYKVLDHHLNTQPAVTYLERVRHKV